MKKILLTIILIALSSISLSQNCSDVNTKIDAKYSYVNTSEDLEIPLNESWNIALENQKAVLVFLQNTSGNATAGIVKNKNGYHINSAHDINENLVVQLIKKMGINLDDRKLVDVKLKNVRAKQIEYNHKVYNLGDTHLMSGIMYMIVNNGYTYVFMFNSTREAKSCYIPYFKSIIKNTYFGPDWY
jgi:hypothetical protein